jgi:hypothetical protein
MVSVYGILSEFILAIDSRIFEKETERVGVITSVAAPCHPSTTRIGHRPAGLGMIYTG